MHPLVVLPERGVVFVFDLAFVRVFVFAFAFAFVFVFVFVFVPVLDFDLVLVLQSPPPRQPHTRHAPSRRPTVHEAPQIFF